MTDYSQSSRRNFLKLAAAAGASSYLLGAQRMATSVLSCATTSTEPLVRQQPRRSIPLAPCLAFGVVLAVIALRFRKSDAV